MSATRSRGVRLVHVRTVPSAFHARVIQARLGADGIPVQLRGNVGGPYPIGEVSIWVAESDAADVQALLLADEVEDAFGGLDGVPTGEVAACRLPGTSRPRLLVAHPRTRNVLAAVSVLLVLAAAFGGRVLG